MSPQYGPHRLLSDLTSLGYSASLVQPPTGEYFVVLNNWLDTGPQLLALDRTATAKIVYTRRF